MKEFFSKMWAAFLNWIIGGFKTKKLAMLGVIFTWVVPVVALATFVGINKNPKLTFQPWVLLAFVVLLIIYYKKIKGLIKQKMLSAEIKGVPICPIYYLINGAIAIVLIGALYFGIDVLVKVNLDNLKKYLAVCMSSIGFGALCYCAHSVNQLQNNTLDSEGHIHNDNNESN